MVELQLPLQFRCKCNGERIVKTGLYLPMIQKVQWHPFCGVQ